MVKAVNMVETVQELPVEVKMVETAKVHGKDI